jgi:hypothetical protein
MTKNFYRNEFVNFRHKLKFGERFALTYLEQKKVNDLRVNGFTTIESNYTDAEIQELTAYIDHSFLKQESKIWVDKQKADYRLFGVEKRHSLIERFQKLDSIFKILDTYTGIKASAVHTMMGRIEAKPDNLGSGGGWHRDTPEFNQVKSILYLSNVDESKGPFQYLAKTHKRSSYKKVSSITSKPWFDFRYTDQDIDLLTDAGYKMHTLTASKGTILLADTSGIHRGMPILKGNRYALTNYIWNQRPVPEHIAQNLV